MNSGPPRERTDPPDQLEQAAARLEATGLYRVLRKLTDRPVLALRGANTPVRKALFVDVETTGLDASRDEIIELAMIAFTYSLEGEIFEIVQTWQGFNQPGRPIPPEITKLTGITDAMVAGTRLDLVAICRIVEGADLIIAHNAAFDRRFLEALDPVFAFKPWACSMSQIGWAEEGFEGSKLPYLAMAAGFFYDRHRAVNDCRAAIELLARPLPISLVPAMRPLLSRARETTWRIWAENAPFDLKDSLKARGYRWNAGGDGSLRAWFIDVSPEAKDAELEFLHQEIYHYEPDLPIIRITAYERFSNRV